MDKARWLIPETKETVQVKIELLLDFALELARVGGDQWVRGRRAGVYPAGPEWHRVSAATDHLVADPGPFGPSHQGVVGTLSPRLAR